MQVDNRGFNPVMHTSVARKVTLGVAFHSLCVIGYSWTLYSCKSTI